MTTTDRTGRAMEIGIDNFVAADPAVTPTRQVQNVLAQIARADRAGVHTFGIGEHHREGFLDSAPVTILAAAAAITERIRLRSAVTVLSADDPVRVFESYATLDLISQGRAELVVGRGSFVTVQMTNGKMPHEKMLRSIELLGSTVIPQVNGIAVS
jgi:alkanesulfonate monooxygenase SsuD/methylene tetrahydromethanopterin reductase-like flavin-dependent oxidoreductase (luciferase family)